MLVILLSKFFFSNNLIKILTNEDLNTIPGRIIAKTLKMVLDTSLVRYVSRVKWSNPGKGVAPSPTPCSREPSGRPRLWLPTLPYNFIIIIIHFH